MIKCDKIRFHGSFFSSTRELLDLLGTASFKQTGWLHLVVKRDGQNNLYLARIVRITNALDSKIDTRKTQSRDDLPLGLSLYRLRRQGQWRPEFTDYVREEYK